MSDSSWMKRGACATSDVDMFPTTDAGAKAAKALCAGCPVVDVCLEWAITQREEHGVWGGMTESERGNAKTRRRKERRLRPIRTTCARPGCGNDLTRRQQNYGNTYCSRECSKLDSGPTQWVRQQTHGITASAYARHFQISNEGARKALRKLVEQGVVVVNRDGITDIYRPAPERVAS